MLGKYVYAASNSSRSHVLSEGSLELPVQYLRLVDWIDVESDDVGFCFFVFVCIFTSLIVKYHNVGASQK